MTDIVVAEHIAEFEPTLSKESVAGLAVTIEDVLNVFEEDGFLMTHEFKLSFIKGLSASLAKGRIKQGHPEVATVVNG